MSAWLNVLMPALVAGVIAYLVSLLTAKTGTKDAERNIAADRRRECLEHARWASDLVGSDSERKQRLGIAHLKALLDDPALEDRDRQRVRITLRSFLKRRLAEIDADPTADVRLRPPPDTEGHQP